MSDHPLGDFIDTLILPESHKHLQGKHNQSSHGARGGGGGAAGGESGGAAAKPAGGGGKGGGETVREQRKKLFDVNDQDGTFVKLDGKRMTVRQARQQLFKVDAQDSASPHSIEMAAPRKGAGVAKGVKGKVEARVGAKNDKLVEGMTLGKKERSRLSGQPWQRFKLADGSTGEALVFPEGSKYGIKGGRVSKLFVRTPSGRTINYDRGWDRGTTTADRDLGAKISAKLSDLMPGGE